MMFGYFATVNGYGSYSDAFNTWLSIIPQNENDSDWKELAVIQLDMLRKQTSWYEIDTSQLETVQTIANKSADNYSTTIARSILYLLFYQEFEEEDLEGGGILRMAENVYDYNAGKEAVLGSISPNPADRFTEINYFLPADISEATISVYDINGKKLKAVSVTNRSTSIQISVAELPNGIYFYSLENSEAILDSKKLVIIHKE